MTIKFYKKVCYYYDIAKNNNTPFTFMDIIEKKKYKKIINDLFVVDQKMRSDFSSGKIKKWDFKIDKESTKKIKLIILKHGWLSSSMVGLKTEKQLWLLVQHSPDTSFQKRCLALMKKYGGNKKNIAYLEDRVRVHEGKKQIYGTQFYLPKGTNGDLQPRPIYDFKNLDKRRKAIGLKSFDLYNKKMLRMFRKHSMYKKK